MSSERVPTRSEVMGWGPQQLSEYLKRVRPPHFNLCNYWQRFYQAFRPESSTFTGWRAWRKTIPPPRVIGDIFKQGGFRVKPAQKKSKHTFVCANNTTSVWEGKICSLANTIFTFLMCIDEPVRLRQGCYEEFDRRCQIHSKSTLTWEWRMAFSVLHNLK